VHPIDPHHGDFDCDGNCNVAAVIFGSPTLYGWKSGLHQSTNTTQKTLAFGDWISYI
jgi:hypothetical protein